MEMRYNKEIYNTNSMTTPGPETAPEQLKEVANKVAQKLDTLKDKLTKEAKEGGEALRSLITDAWQSVTKDIPEMIDTPEEREIILATLQEKVHAMTLEKTDAQNILKYVNEVAQDTSTGFQKMMNSVTKSILENPTIKEWLEKAGVSKEVLEGGLSMLIAFVLENKISGIAPGFSEAPVAKITSEIRWKEAVKMAKEQGMDDKTIKDTQKRWIAEYVKALKVHNRKATDEPFAAPSIEDILKIMKAPEQAPNQPGIKNIEYVYQLITSKSGTEVISMNMKRDPIQPNYILIKRADGRSFTLDMKDVVSVCTFTEVKDGIGTLAVSTQDGKNYALKLDELNAALSRVAPDKHDKLNNTLPIEIQAA